MKAKMTEYDNLKKELKFDNKKIILLKYKFRICE